MALAMQRRRRDRVVWPSVFLLVRAAPMSRAILLWAKKSLLIIPTENSREKQTASSLQDKWQGKTVGPMLHYVPSPSLILTFLPPFLRPATQAR